MNVDQEEIDLHVVRLRAHGTDDARCEAKACAGGLGSAVWESTSAFANTRGGLLLLGLAEAAGFLPATGFDPDRVVDQFVEGIGDGGGPGKLTNAPSYAIERFTVDDGPVVAIEIAENGLAHKPCYLTARGPAGGSYMRVDDKDLRLSPTEVFELQQALRPQASDREPVPETDVSDLDEELVNQLVDARRRSKSLAGASSRDEQLVRLNVMTKAGQVRLAGLLTTGRYAQQFLPRLLIDVAVHPDVEKSRPGSALRFVDRVQCDGPLAAAIDEAVEAAARNLRTFSVIEGTARRDQVEIPREVLREAIANAVLHREYHELFRGQPVTVDVFPDRVLITNPGGLWGGKTLDNLDDGTSRCRNQVLMQLLQNVPFAGGEGLTVEGQGGGVRLMINQMRAQALEPPRFRATADQVVVELRRHGAEVPQLRSWLRGLTDEALTPAEDSALLIAKQAGSVSVSRLRDDLRVDSDDARVLLAGLTSRGLLLPDGGGYVLWSDRRVLRPSEAEVIAGLSSHVARDIHELAEALGKTTTALRPILRRLVKAGYVEPTAPPTSRLRKYRLQS